MPVFGIRARRVRCSERLIEFLLLHWLKGFGFDRVSCHFPFGPSAK